MWPSVLLHSLSPVLNAAKAQSVEAELIDNHREEVIQLKKLVTQKEEDLHKTVQKYEQVLQVARKTTFCLDLKVKAEVKKCIHPISIWKPLVLAAAHWAVVFLFGSLSYELEHLLH